MAFRRLSQQAEVIALIGAWPNKSAASRSRGDCRQFIQKILAILTQGGTHFEQRAQLGRPRKLTGEILARIEERYSVLNDEAKWRFKVATLRKIMVQNKLFQLTEIHISITLKKVCKVEQLIWANFICRPVHRMQPQRDRASPATLICLVPEPNALRCRATAASNGQFSWRIVPCWIVGIPQRENRHFVSDRTVSFNADP
jgi:hypothetical protein